MLDIHMGPLDTAPLPPLRDVNRVTDQAALGWILTTTDQSGRLMRWCLRLTELDFQKQYKTGRSITQADDLSQHKTSAEAIAVYNEDLPTLKLSEEQEHSTKTYIFRLLETIQQDV